MGAADCLATLAVATMVVGNLVALQQTNIKRLLAYSSIGQVGFMLMAITTISDVSASALLLHLGGYLYADPMGALAKLIIDNGFTGPEILRIPKGTRVRYYV